MNKKSTKDLTVYIPETRMPRYSEIPNVGLYLEQVARFINDILASLGCAPITTSMISNYVKHGLIDPPKKKLYYAEQIAYLIFIAISKNTLSLDNIRILIGMQRNSYDAKTAYDYFCLELENMLAYVFGHKEEPDRNIGVTTSEEKSILRNVIISVSHSIYLSACFSDINKRISEISDTESK